MNIILIGPHAAGKTTLGKMLADQLWKSFVEADAESLVDALAKDEQVIALHADALAKPKARRALVDAADAIRIHLHCEPDALHQRIPDATPATDHEAAYRAAADHVFDTTELDADATVRFLIQRCL